MKNPSIRELIGKLANGEISKEEFDLFLEKIKSETDSMDIDQAFQEIFDVLDPDGKDTDPTDQSNE
ncbi:hypothetical protein LZF95_23375 [Algoriphagus sp. AGSA1]|uniref:hypothetical protein n=1 Tax=Algoriphagus sp. AGSA1 TaxID=2907213 RepID=UPI001F2E828C|nr:hypothetical protein [Algoriphagus sp. AGSA1]MCE7057643.1 hypothetical protein [Algoriphagus sp. AGSA1]